MNSTARRFDLTPEQTARIDAERPGDIIRQARELREQAALARATPRTVYPSALPWSQATAYRTKRRTTSTLTRSCEASGSAEQPTARPDMTS